MASLAASLCLSTGLRLSLGLLPFELRDERAAAPCVHRWCRLGLLRRPISTRARRGPVPADGLHHWWLDCDEPCGGTNNGTYATDWLYNNGKWPAGFVGAAYPQMLERTVYEGMGAPGKEFEHDNVMLGRAAWAGSQRYGGAVWSGDTSSTWRDLNQQFRAGLNMALACERVGQTERWAEGQEGKGG